MAQQHKSGGRMVLILGGLVFTALGLTAVLVQAWRWSEGSATYVASTVAMVMGLMFTTFGVIATVAGLRMRRPVDP